MIAHKFLSRGAIGPFSGFEWPTPTGSEPGDWVRVAGELEPCGRGIHACRLHDLPYWLNDELWEIELGGEIVEERRGLIAEQGRLLKRIDAWTATAEELALSCARHARDTAVRVLAAHGLAADAAALAGEARLPALAGEFGRLARSASGDYAVHVAAYAADVAEYAQSAVGGDATWASCTAYVTAVLEGYVSTGDASRSRQALAYAAERERQAEWLAERLQLVVGGL